MTHTTLNGHLKFSKHPYKLGRKHTSFKWLVSRTGFDCNKTMSDKRITLEDPSSLRKRLHNAHQEQNMSAVMGLRRSQLSVISQNPFRTVSQRISQPTAHI